MSPAAYFNHAADVNAFGTKHHEQDYSYELSTQLIGCSRLAAAACCSNRHYNRFLPHSTQHKAQAGRVRSPRRTVQTLMSAPRLSKPPMLNPAIGSATAPSEMRWEMMVVAPEATASSPGCPATAARTASTAPAAEGVW